MMFWDNALFKAWDESRHPRAPSNTETGGQFISASGASSFREHPSDDPEKWKAKDEHWIGTNKKPANEMTEKGVTYRYYPMPNEPGVFGDIVAIKDNHVVGNLFFAYRDRANTQMEGAVEVHPKYRRRGIATAMYRWGEKLSGESFYPATSHTADAEAFWNQRNRKFGRGFDDIQRHLSQ